MKEIFTIGYSGFKIDDFINILKLHNINIVVDVRSNPNSKFYPEYNRPSIEKILEINRIFYRNFHEEFGARQLDSSFFAEGGYLEFDKFVKSKQFISGVNKVEKGISAGYTFVLLCAEKNPAVCHRTIMVAREFSKLGYQIIHLMPEGQNITQSEIEENLLDNYYSNSQQISLFSRDEMINDAYAKRNAEIGYKIEDE